jgi:hypothetical protein
VNHRGGGRTIGASPETASGDHPMRDARKKRRPF